MDTLLKLLDTDSFHTDLVLLDILRDGLTRWHQSLPSLEIQQYPQEYSALITSQSAIGWDHLYRGRWSKEWSKLQQSYLKKNSLTSPKCTGKHWVLAAGRHLIDRWFKVWDARNKARHGVDDDAK